MAKSEHRKTERPERLESRVLRALQTAFAAFLFGGVVYLVLGGLASGHGGLHSALGPVGRLLAFLLLVSVLAAFEGLQISVTTLRLKDLDALHDRLPRAYRLHRRFRRERETRRFLAGRQLFVVMVVFFTAQLASFPAMTAWPGTGAEFPPWLMPWFKVIFLDLGVAGAFLVLWAGQLAPQFLANRHPHDFLNLPGMRAVLWLSFLVESIGLTRPGEWLAAMGRNEEDSPSPRDLELGTSVRLTSTPWWRRSRRRRG